MPRMKTVIAAMVAITQTFWLLPAAHAEKDNDQRRQQPAQHRPAEKPRHNPHHGSAQMPHHQAEPMQAHPGAEWHGDVRIGGYFQPQHREAAQQYYGRPENQGFCPPGLAKKPNGCLPPGQARKWRRGEPLPRGVVYYEVPRSVVLTLGVPPQGYQYVRVASDILLIALGSRMVIDAMEDLVR